MCSQAVFRRCLEVILTVGKNVGRCPYTVCLGQGVWRFSLAVYMSAAEFQFSLSLGLNGDFVEAFKLQQIWKEEVSDRELKLGLRGSGATVHNQLGLCESRIFRLLSVPLYLSSFPSVLHKWSCSWSIPPVSKTLACVCVLKEYMRGMDHRMCSRLCLTP